MAARLGQGHVSCATRGTQHVGPLPIRHWPTIIRSASHHPVPLLASSYSKRHEAMHASGLHQRLHQRWANVSAAASKEPRQDDSIISSDHMAADQQEDVAYDGDLDLDIEIALEEEQQEQAGELGAEDDADQDWIDLDDPFDDTFGSEDDLAVFAPAKRRPQSDGEQSDGYYEDEEDDWDDGDVRERVFLVGVALKGQRQRFGYSIEESLEELGRLADTAGLRVMGSTYQILEAPNMSTYIGAGKVAEVARAVRAWRADTVIFDDELSPGQLRNLEKAFSGGKEGGGGAVRVCDRTALILDIFSQRAATREGKLQVDLAQVEYQLPRLTRMWTHLDRVGGGGQVKGTGETQIEIDKRILKDKAAQLRRELQSVRTHRKAYRDRRSETPIPVVALVGYTNAGKSTLLNTLTSAGVLAEDKLFATLDPTTRRVRLKGNKEVLFSDTVGFIQKLPTQLVAAFRATLEEIQDASLVLHVVDASHDNSEAQSGAVLQVLEEIQAQHIPVMTAWNKVDACPDQQLVRALAADQPDTLVISGRSGEGLPELLAAIGGKLQESMVQVEVLLPYSAGDLVDDVHKAGSVQRIEYVQEGARVSAKVPAQLAGRLQPYSLEPIELPQRQAKARLDEGTVLAGLTVQPGWENEVVELV